MQNPMAMATSTVMIPVACLVVLVASYGAEAAIGMNWGRETAQRLLPSQVVDLLLQNGIGNARVYTAQKDILAAFAGSGINLTITINNPASINSTDLARAFVADRKEFFIPSMIRCIYVGSGYLFDVGRDKASISSSINVLRLLQRALNERQLGHQVKANFVHYDMALKPNITMPSEAEFRDELKEGMIEFLQFLQENDAPFAIQLFPLEVIDRNPFLDFSFGFPDNKSTTIITDAVNGFVYNNMFEWQYDSYVWALNKLNASNIKIVVSQVGWPTDGYAGANVTNAERFWKHLLPLVTSNKGTPMRPGAPIDINVHALADETKNGNVFARHWGVYHSNGEPKYKIDLTGQSRDIYPAKVRGIMRMPNRWCVFNGDVRRNTEKLNRLFAWACNKTDCSSLAPGGSCGDLSFTQNVSFAFNMYFQFTFQDEAACDFEGLGRMTVENPSMGTCVFPVEVVKGQQTNYKAPTASYGFRRSPNLLFWVWISLFFM